MRTATGIRKPPFVLRGHISLRSGGHRSQPHTPVHPVGGWHESVHDLFVEDEQEDNKNNGEADAEGFLCGSGLAFGVAS
jgi:hypothetical protein